MDVYHKVLSKLYQITDGKGSQAVDLKDLVKNLGFLGSYNDILQQLSGQGWIAETPKLNYVRITHWGVNEIKNSTNNQPDNTLVIKREANRLVAETKQFSIMLEEFAADISKEKFVQVEKKLNDLTTAIGKLKSSI
jgi:hypothetical protein